MYKLFFNSSLVSRAVCSARETPFKKSADIGKSSADGHIIPGDLADMQKFGGVIKRIGFGDLIFQKRYILPGKVGGKISAEDIVGTICVTLLQAQAKVGA